MQGLTMRVALLLAAVLFSPMLRAELGEIKVAQQYGISYLPLMLMEEQKLIEKHAKAAGVDVKVGWAKVAGGNVIGNPILPVIKVCANPRTVRTMSEHVDVDTSGLLQRELTMGAAGDKLLDMMFRTANGRLTAAEALGHREFVMTRLYESA